MPQPLSLLRRILIIIVLAGVGGNAVAFEPVEASMLVAEPGEMVYQCTGHAAIRLQCPAYGLDNVFSFETDYSGGLAGQILGQAKGKFQRITFEEYCSGFAAEGRGITEFPLNLTDGQIRHLWMLCDNDAESGSERRFNIRWQSCNSEAVDKICAALADENIMVRSDSVSEMDNGEWGSYFCAEHSPWSTMIIIIGLGTGAQQTDSWRTRMFPVSMAYMLPKAIIRSTDGTERPLLTRVPTEILPSRRLDGAPWFTPVVFFALVLAVSIVISAADLSGRWPRMVAVADRVALLLQSAVSLALIAVAVMPLSIGGAWNWLYLPLNPLPALVWLFCRHRRWVPGFFAAYGAVCVLFIAAPLFTSNAGMWSSLLAAAIAVRVLTHYLPIISKQHK